MAAVMAPTKIVLKFKKAERVFSVGNDVFREMASIQAAVTLPEFKTSEDDTETWTIMIETSPSAFHPNKIALEFWLKFETTENYDLSYGRVSINADQRTPPDEPAEQVSVHYQQEAYYIPKKLCLGTMNFLDVDGNTVTVHAKIETCGLPGAEEESKPAPATAATDPVIDLAALRIEAERAVCR